MFAKLSSLFLIYRLCLSSAVSDLAINITQEAPFEERDIEKRDLGIFDKGSSWSSSDGAVSLNIPAAHFCGSETLNQVAKYSNPQKFEDTSMRAYLNDLKKADITTRKTMVRNTALRVAGKITTACDANLDGQLSRKLLNTNPDPELVMVQNAIKKTAFVGSALGLIYYFTDSARSESSPEEMTLVLAGTIAANRVLFYVINAMNDPRQANARLLDEYRALAAVINVIAIDWTLNYFNTLILAHGCPVVSSNDLKQAFLSLNNWNTTGSNIRPHSDLDQINSQPNKNACPDNPLEAGNSGEVVG